MSTTLRRIDELQADQALWGLDPGETAELERILHAHDEEPDGSWESAAAMATNALMRPMPGMPSPELLERLRQSAPVAIESEHPRRTRSPWVSQFLLAAAVTLAAILWWDRPGNAPEIATQRETLLQSRTASLWSWTKGDSPLSGSAAGDVVWDPQTRKGFMRFCDLPANDPSERQYQLWIFDAKRSAAQPVDGGVFDVPRGQAEIVIPIAAKLLVFEAAAFVVTAENPGGVVVSKREHIVALAKPE